MSDASDATRRGIRTALQLLVTLLSTGATVSLIRLFGVDVTAEQWAVVAGVALPFVTALLNALEDAGTIPALLKADASDGENPIPGSAGGLR